MAKAPLTYVCQACGAVHSKWAGRCDACGALRIGIFAVRHRRQYRELRMCARFYFTGDGGNTRRTEHVWRVGVNPTRIAWLRRPARYSIIRRYDEQTDGTL